MKNSHVTISVFLDMIFKGKGSVNVTLTVASRCTRDAQICLIFFLFEKIRTNINNFLFFPLYPYMDPHNTWMGLHMI